MSLRGYLQRLEVRGELVRVHAPVSKRYEMAGILKRLEPRPVLFEDVRESRFGVVGNVSCTKAMFADYFSMPVKEIIPRLAQAIEARSPCEVVDTAPCQEVVVTEPDLDALPSCGTARGMEATISLRGLRSPDTRNTGRM